MIIKSEDPLTPGQRRIEAAPPTFSEALREATHGKPSSDFDKVEAVYAGVDLSRNTLLDDVVWKPEPLTFDVRLSSHAYQRVRRGRVRLERAVMFKRQGCKVDGPNRPLTGSDFADYGDRILLAELGYFSCDLPEAKAKRDRQAQIEAYIDEAYDVMGLDRNQQHALIAAKMEATRFDGIWARSTGEYAAACRRLDDAILAANPAIAKSVDELRTEIKQLGEILS